MLKSIHIILILAIKGLSAYRGGSMGYQDLGSFMVRGDRFKPNNFVSCEQINPCPCPPKKNDCSCEKPKCKTVCFTEEVSPCQKKENENQIICIKKSNDEKDLCKIVSCIEKIIASEQIVVERTTHNFLRNLKCCLLKRLGLAKLDPLIVELDKLLNSITDVITNNFNFLEFDAQALITSQNSSLNAVVDTLVRDANTFILANIPDVSPVDNLAIKLMIDKTLVKLIEEIKKAFDASTTQGISSMSKIINTNKSLITAEISNLLSRFSMFLGKFLDDMNKEDLKTVRNIINRLGRNYTLALEDILNESSDKIIACLVNDQNCPEPRLSVRLNNNVGFEDCDSDPCQ